jgi:preprotein translocase subunit SecD
MLGVSMLAASRTVEMIRERGDLGFYDLTPSLLPPSIDAARQVVAHTSRSALAGAGVRPRARVITCDSTTAVVCPGALVPVPGVTYYYLFKHEPQLTGSDLKRSATRQDVDPVSGVPIVTIQFTAHGNRVFHDITRAEAVRGAALGNDNFQSFAIVVDDRLRSFPTIDYHLYPAGIDPSGAGAQITGAASITQAQRLALILRTGTLPVRFVVVSRRSFS